MKTIQRIVIFAIGLILTAINAQAGRWITPDPMDIPAHMERDPHPLLDLNLYTFVANSPMNYIDPLGMVTAVAIGLPTSSNPFGHAAIATTSNGVVSFGTGTQFGSSFTDYLNNQATHRNTVVYFLNTTPQQEKAINDYLNTQKGKPINAYPDNCATRTKSALEAAGFSNYFPQQPVVGVPGVDTGGTVPTPNLPIAIAHALDWVPGTVQISVPQGATLPPNFLTGFNPKK